MGKTDAIKTILSNIKMFVEEDNKEKYNAIIPNFIDEVSPELYDVIYSEEYDFSEADINKFVKYFTSLLTEKITYNIINGQW